jgi:2'-5' RNA ligase|tara:strand:- start:1455 stop:2030 length:576 start_codon:yes stop_codon:yes gene_type:complete
MEKKLLRTFISIPLPHVVKNVKQMLTSTFENDRVKIRWVKHNNLHLTLHFLGFTPVDDIPKIEKEISSIIKSQKSFDLTISETGCLPDILKPSVLYLGVDNDLKALNVLVNKISLKMTALGYKRRDESYIPHVTIGKINYPQKFKPDLSIFLNSTYDKIEFSVEKIQFSSSEILPEGVAYNILNTFSLSKN